MLCWCYETLCELPEKPQLVSSDLYLIQQYYLDKGRSLTYTLHISANMCIFAKILHKNGAVNYILSAFFRWFECNIITKTDQVFWTQDSFQHSWCLNRFACTNHRKFCDPHQIQKLEKTKFTAQIFTHHLGPRFDRNKQTHTRECVCLQRTEAAVLLVLCSTCPISLQLPDQTVCSVSVGVPECNLPEINGKSLFAVKNEGLIQSLLKLLWFLDQSLNNQVKENISCIYNCNHLPRAI